MELGGAQFKIHLSQAIEVILQGADWSTVFFKGIVSA